MENSEFLKLNTVLLFFFGYTAPAVFAFFSAYWAQQTQRNPWLWFFFGLVLTPIAGVVLLWKNGQAHSAPPRLNDAGRSDLLATRKDIV
jgi:hypothetical protein